MSVKPGAAAEGVRPVMIPVEDNPEAYGSALGEAVKQMEARADSRQRLRVKRRKDIFCIELEAASHKAGSVER